MSPESNHQDPLDEIRSFNPMVGEVLQCSPFEATKNFGGRLTSALFFERLFIRTEAVKSLDAELLKVLTSELVNHRVVFLEGYSGTGKTTFVHHFVKEHSEFEAVYIDFYPGQTREPFDVKVPKMDDVRDTEIELLELQQHLSDRREKDLINKAILQLRSVRTVSKQVVHSDQQTHPIATVLKLHLSRRKPEIDQLLYYLQENRQSLYDYFETFSDTLENLEPAKALTQLGSLWQKATLRDTFVLLLLCYINKYRSQYPDNRKRYLFVFDNLDTIDLAYITPFFKESFANSLGVFSQLLQDTNLFPKRLDFEHDFKFLFCLRDANNSTVNAHLSDILLPITANIYLRVGFEGELYKTAITKRLAFHEEVTKNKKELNQEVQKVVTMLRAFASDKFFTQILVPLYNSDFRKLSTVLFEVTMNLIQLPTEPSGLSFEDVGTSFVSNFEDKYGVRGALFFGIIQKLQEDNFLGNYPFIKERPGESSGYCLITRMLLTLLLNRSKLNRGEDVFKKPRPFSDVALGEILEESRDIYRIDEILQNLVDVFLFHKRSWVHLITFRGRPVENVEAFRDDLDKMASDSELPISWYETFVTLNPAGYIFLKNVLVHFEFYSVMAGNSSALFVQGLRRSETEPKRFEFEETISRVQKLVARHSKAMRHFLDLKFEKSARQMSKEDYLKSDFTFRHFKHGAPFEEGLFHATRIVSQHVAYMDFFRLRVLSNAEPRSKIEINSKLVDFIERYLLILDTWPDGMSRARNDMLQNINAIKRSGYTDSTRPINLPFSN